MVKFNGGPWDGQFACMELYMPGVYEKHNCNVPAGRALTPRCTPQVRNLEGVTFLLKGGIWVEGGLMIGSLLSSS